MLLIIAIIGSVLFTVGSILDASYSTGLKERNPLFKGKGGYFSATRYWLISAGGGAMCWILTLLYPHWSMYVATGGVLGYLGGLRLYVGLRTRKALGK